jgi:D-sedoheptulose 7-phosphate isomerase
MRDYVARELASHAETLERLTATLQDAVVEAANMIADCLANGGKVLLCGNGGSAADAQHIAAELVGRFVAEREGFAAIALTTDTSALTSISNDLGYEQVFARQVRALARRGDVLVAISTSGGSANVNRAIEAARTVGCTVVGWTGRGGGSMAPLCDLALVVPSDDTQRIQEMHILIGHILCGIVERRLCR